MLVIPNQGEALLLDAATGKTPITALTLRLFSNDHTPTKDTTEANVTEVAGGGYAAVALTAASWTTTPGSPTVSVYPEQTWTFTGATNAPGTVYGYYITDAAGKLVAIERMGAVFVPANNGDTTKVTPQLSLGSTSGD